MKVELRERTEETVRIYFETVRRQGLDRTLPQRAKTAEEAVSRGEDLGYENLPLANQTSYSLVKGVDDQNGTYAGDVWCYAMDEGGEPQAMVSYCVFEEYQGKGVAAEGVSLFLKDTDGRYGCKSYGAFVYLDNIPSVRVLEKCGFRLMEEIEEGRLSGYFQLDR